MTSIPLSAIQALMEAEIVLNNTANSIYGETEDTKVNDEGLGIVIALRNLKDEIHKVHCEWEADRNAG